MKAALAALAAALALPVLPLTASAADEPGSGFASVGMSATARGQEFLFRAEIPGQLSVPYAQSKLQFGEGSSTATVGWPGDTAATLGTTLVLLGAPQQLTVLNDPAVAYARSGTGDADVTNTTVPGTTMRATATAQRATAVASADGAEALTAVAGRISSQTSVALTGPAKAAATATSSVRDVTLAGGIVTVRSVVSTATGTTDGVAAAVTGSTVVSDVAVAGIPVTVDEKGVSVAGAEVLPAGAADAVTQALAGAQVTLSLTAPVKRVKGGTAEYSTGALVAVTPLGTVTLGGAQLTLSATRGDDALPEPTAPVAPPTVDVPQPPGVDPVGPVTGPDPAPPPGPVVMSPPTGPLALVPISLRTGYGWVWLVSGLLLAFAASSGLLALSRRWLAPDLSGCPLEGRPA